MLKIILTTFLILTHCEIAFADSLLKCADLLDAKSPVGAAKTVREVLAVDAEVHVRSKTGETFPLTFSHDTELEGRDWMNMLMGDPVSLEKLDQLLGNVSFEKAAATLNMSEAQLRGFAIRSGVVFNRYNLRITDFKPGFAIQILNTRENIGNPFRITLMKIIDSYVKDHQLPLKPHWDVDAVEIAHSSFEKTPKAAEKMIDWLFSEFSKPNSHFHIGLPSKAVTEIAALKITRIIESLVLLNRAENPPEALGEMGYTSSALWHGFDGAFRGPVFLKTNEFSTPTPSHDLEIRQYEGKVHAKALIALAIKLATHAGELHETQDSYPSTGKNTDNSVSFGDRKLGNIYGALEFATEVLSRSPSEKHHQIALGLKKFIPDGVIEPTTLPTHEQRVELSEFLKENRVEQILRDWRLYYLSP